MKRKTLRFCERQYVHFFARYDLNVWKLRSKQPGKFQIMMSFCSHHLFIHHYIVSFTLFWIFVLSNVRSLETVFFFVLFHLQQYHFVNELFFMNTNLTAIPFLTASVIYLFNLDYSIEKSWTVCTKCI